MSDRHSPSWHDRLRDALRRGDPASGEAGLPVEETRAMRRSILVAVEEPRRPRRLVLAFAAAAAAALSLLVALALWRSGDGGAREPAPAPRAAAVPAAPAASQPPPALVPAPSIARYSQRSQRSQHAPATARRRPPRAPQVTTRLAAMPAPSNSSAPDRPVEEIAPEESVLTRQVQFATAGGTRIIWMLPERTR